MIIDGLNLFIRHFVVNPTIGSSGEHVGGIVGFLRALSHLTSRTRPQRIIVVWEGGGSPRRRAIFKSYKSGKRPQKLNRFYGEEMPNTVENRNSQISSLISILRQVCVDQFYISDCEADDIIAYIVKHLLPENRRVIASSDKDLYQLLDKKTVQWSPGQKKFLTMKDVLSKFGVSSVNFCTARSFIGDSSDGLPGIRLAGFANLSKRFPQLGGEKFISVEDIIVSCESQENKLKLISNIKEHADIARRNWKLMYLDVKNLSASQIEKIKYNFDNPSLSSNKIQLIKELSNLGIVNFDVDSFYSTINSTRNNS